MRTRGKAKSVLSRKFFRHMLSVRSIRAKNINIPFHIAADDIMTGYMGEKMHQELRDLKRSKSRNWREY